MKLLFSLILIICSSYFNFVKGEEIDSTSIGFSYINYSTKDGLPSNEVYSVFEDSKGYIWVGTDRGIVRFDGYDFKVYTTEDGISDNVIFDITEDSIGRIWFTTSNRTLCYFLDGEFVIYDEIKINGIVSESGFKNALFFDKIKVIQDSLLVLESERSGFITLNLLTENWTNDLKLMQLSSYKYNTFVQSIKYLYFTQSLKYPKKFEFVTPTNNTFEFDLDEFEDNRFYSFVKDSTTFIYGGNYHIRIDSNGLYYKLLPEDVRVFGIKDYFLFNYFSYNKGPVYLSNSPDILQAKEVLLNLPLRLTRSEKDRNNGIWLGTLQSGLFYIPNLAVRVIHNDMNTTGIIPTLKGLIFIDRLHEFYFYNTKSKSVNKVDSFLLSNLYGVNTDIINLSNSIIAKDVTRFIREYYTDFTGSQFRSIQISNDTVLVKIGSKLISFNKSGTITILNSETYNSPSYSLAIIDGDSVVGTKNGIYKLDKTRLSPYMLDYKIFDKRAQDIKYIKKLDLIIIATIGNGLYLYKNRKLIKHYKVENGLMSNTINQIFNEDNNRIWIATNKGVNYLDITDTNNFKMHSLFSSSKSLLSPNIQQIYLHQDSLLYLGTDRGVNEINLNTLFKQRHSTIPLLLNKIKINESEISVDRFIGCELDFDENNIVFSYNAMAFSKFGDLNFRYRLIGVTDNWIYTRNRTVSFLQLTPGTYEFEIETQNEFGDWLGFEKIITFNINKPYWKTLWFILGILFLVIVMVGGIMYYYILNLKNEKKLLEQQQFLSNQLNQSRQKALNSQLNPHFVFNSLNSIQNYILTKKTELSSDYLSMFSKLMRYVFENSKKLFVPLSDEIQALELYISLEKVRHDNAFDYEIQFDENIVSKIHMPSLLVQPIIENAIWHGLLTKKGSDKMLTVSFNHINTELHIVIQDNGVGRKFSKAKPKVKLIKKQKSSGVDLTKERIALLKDSTGLNASFEVEDLYNENNEGIGTKITIIIPDNLNSVN